jgi:hypothetical protein
MIYQTTWCHTPEDHGLNIHRCKQLPDWRVDGGSGFLRYLAPYLPNCTVSHPDGHKFNECDKLWTKCCMCGVEQIISSSVCRATSYGLDDRGVGFRVPVGSRNFLFSTSSRPAMEPIQPPIQWVPGAICTGIKRPGREADHSLPNSTEVKKIWIYTTTPPYVFMA